MKALAGIGVGLGVLAIGFALWVLRDGRLDAQQARAEADRLHQEVLESRNDVSDAQEEAAALESRVVEQASEVALLKEALRAQPHPDLALGPRGADIVERVTLDGAAGEPPRVAVAWAHGPADLPRRAGIFVWEPVRGRLTAPGVPDQSTLVFGINLQAGRRVTVGIPGQTVTSRASALFSADIVQARDVTGDGYRDLLTLEASTGSGGCGTWRVIAASDGSMRQIFRRATCEADIRITGDGGLRIRQAFRPPECPSIHGCANRYTTLRWNGERWVRVSRRVADIG